MQEETSPNYNEWRIIQVDKDGNIVRDATKHNIVVETGRSNLAKAMLPFGVTPWQIGYMGAGSSSTAEAATQTALVTELTADSSRKAIKKVGGGSTPFSGGDLVSDVTTISGYTFRYSVTLEVVYDYTDPNNGSNFREYALFDSSTFGAGNMYCRVVDTITIAKDSSTKIIVQVKMRW